MIPEKNPATAAKRQSTPKIEPKMMAAYKKNDNIVSASFI